VRAGEQKFDFDDEIAFHWVQTNSDFHFNCNEVKQKILLQWFVSR